MSKPFDMREHIRQSNLIEGIDDPKEDARSLRAWNWFINNMNGSSIMSTGMVLELHRRITLKQLSVHQRGKWRTIEVRVGTYYPPAATFVVHLMSELIDSLRHDWQKLDPKERHIRFEKIHPFVDGNGRTGRMIMWWHEMKLGREPTLILNDTKHEDYYQWFREKL